MILPVKLAGHTMTPAGQIKPLSMSLNWRINGLSSCSMTLDLDADPAPALGDWVLITAPMGHQSGVFYVKSIKTDYVKLTYSITLEHTFGLLQEMVAFGDITPETIGGSGTTSISSTTAINYLLGRQTETLWTLYQNDFASESQGWKFQYQDIYTALDSIVSSIPKCQWEFDQTSLPWKVSLKAWPTATTMEMRQNRNIENMSVTVDRSNMFTRVYPTGKKDLHIGSVNGGVDYLEKNVSTWGVISKTLTDSSIDSATLLKAWAQAELDRNSEPAISVSIGGLELSAATGESLDALTIGRLCRVPLPEYSTTVTERIVELAWRDCIISEEQVQVTLANELRTIQSVLYELTKSGHTGKKSNTSKDCDLHEQEEHLEEFDNADIWVNRDSVWAVCGAYNVYTDGDGVTHLQVKEGSALTITRNGSELGLYDQGNLTAGIMVGKINSQSSQTAVKIKANMIELDGETIANLIQNEEIYINNKIDVGGYFSYQASDVSWCSFIIDGVEYDEPMFLGTGDLSFSVADTQVCQALVSAAGQITGRWSQIHSGDTYSPVYTASTSQDSESITVGVSPNGWAGVSAGHPGSCIVYATAGGANRAHVSISGSEPYQQGFIDGGGGASGTVTGSWSGKTFTATNGSSSVSTTISNTQGAWDSSWVKPIYIKADGNTIDTLNINAASVYDTGARDVDFNAFTFSGDTHITITRTMYANITNGKQKAIENQLLLDYNSDNGQDGWFGSAPNYQKYVFWRTAPEGTTSWSSRMRGTISGQWVYNKGYADGVEAAGVDSSAIQINVPTICMHQTKPSGYTEIFTGGRINTNNRYYAFQAKINGQSGYKGYCFYVSV